jgi:hypothetical protein
MMWLAAAPRRGVALALSPRRETSINPIRCLAEIRGSRFGQQPATSLGLDEDLGHSQPQRKNQSHELSVDDKLLIDFRRKQCEGALNNRDSFVLDQCAPVFSLLWFTEAA